MNNLIKFVMSSACLIMLSTSALASNYGFLNNTAMTYFTQQDWQLFNKAQRMALGSRDGVRIQWKNPQSGSYGYIVPSNTTRHNGTTCRDLTFVTTANLVNGQATERFCRNGNQWEIY